MDAELTRDGMNNTAGGGCPFDCARCHETAQDCASCVDCGYKWAEENFTPEKFTDTERLEVLMQHPDKLFIDGSGSSRMYSGAESDGAWGKGFWHYDPRAAVDDLVRRIRRDAPAPQQAGA